MIKELKKKNLSCKLLPLLKKQLKNQRLRLNVLSQEKINQVPLSILTKVQPSNGEQKSDLEVTLDGMSVVTLVVFSW